MLFESNELLQRFFEELFLFCKSEASILFVAANKLHASLYYSLYIFQLTSYAASDVAIVRSPLVLPLIPLRML